VIAWGRAPRDLRVGCDRGDPPRSSRHHGGHGHTAGAVITVTAAAGRAVHAESAVTSRSRPAR
jgi:hypothetical protein